MQIQGTSKLLSYEIEWNPGKCKDKVKHVVRAYNIIAVPFSGNK